MLIADHEKLFVGGSKSALGDRMGEIKLRTVGGLYRADAVKKERYELAAC